MTTLLSPKKRVLNTVFRSGITEGLDIRVKLLTRSKVTAVMYIHNIHIKLKVKKSQIYVYVGTCVMKF